MWRFGSRKRDCERLDFDSVNVLYLNGILTSKTNWRDSKEFPVKDVHVDSWTNLDSLLEVNIALKLCVVVRPVLTLDGRDG